MKTVQMSKKAQQIIGSRKRNCFVTEIPEVRELNTASYWDGGSRSVFTVYNLNTGERKSPPCGQYPQFNASYKLLPFEVLIQNGVFCGKSATPEITYLKGDRAMTAVVFDLPINSEFAYGTPDSGE